MGKILFIGDYTLYKEKFRTSDYMYQIDFLDSLSAESASSVFTPYNMVLLDHNTLAKHSYALCYIAKEMHIPVIFLFATTCKETDILHSFDVGSDDYIYHSLSTSAILSKMNIPMTKCNLFSDWVRPLRKTRAGFPEGSAVNHNGTLST